MELVDTRDLNLEGNFVPVQVRLWAPLIIWHDKLVKVSVLLPAFDDHHNLLKQLSCIEDQTYRIHELIVVDSSSNDLTQLYSIL